jgi:hypothetical protein
MLSRRACAVCGRPLLGRRADALYCSPACRQRAHRGVTRRSDGTQAGSPDFAQTTAKLSRLSAHFSQVNAPEKPRGSVASIIGPADVLAIELGGGWRSVISPDGVACEVRQIRRRALAERGAR